MAANNIFYRFHVLTLILLAPNASASSGDAMEFKDTTAFDTSVTAHAPQLARLQAAAVAAQANRAQWLDQYGPELYSQLSQIETKERALFAFAPVFSPIRAAEVGVRKKTTFGIDLTAGVNSTQQSAQIGTTYLERATTTIAHADIAWDLWRNFLGRTARNELGSQTAAEDQAKLEEKVNRRAFQISLRQLYWDFVANERSKTVSQELLEAAEVQLKDAKNRFANSVADRGELARYESQVAARRARLAVLDFERDLLEKHLKELLPEYQSKKILISLPDIQKTTALVLACTDQVMKSTTPPLENSLYDELIESVRQRKQAQTKVNNAYNDIDLKFTGQIRTTGVDNINPGTLGGSYNDIRNNNRVGYTVGLQLAVPLSGSRNTTTAYYTARDDLLAEAEITELNSKLIATHEQFIQSVSRLIKAAEYEKENGEKLALRVKDMKRKYSQARISVSDLINDQDALLRAELGLIDIQNKILHSLFGYLLVYSDTPCAFNIKEAAL